MKPRPRKLALLMSIAGLGISLSEGVQARSHAAVYTRPFAMEEWPFAVDPDAAPTPVPVALAELRPAVVPPAGAAVAALPGGTAADAGREDASARFEAPLRRASGLATPPSAVVGPAPSGQRTGQAGLLSGSEPLPMAPPPRQAFESPRVRPPQAPRYTDGNHVSTVLVAGPPDPGTGADTAADTRADAARPGSGQGASTAAPPLTGGAVGSRSAPVAALESASPAASGASGASLAAADAAPAVLAGFDLASSWDIDLGYGSAPSRPAAPASTAASRVDIEIDFTAATSVAIDIDVTAAASVAVAAAASVDIDIAVAAETSVDIDVTAETSVDIDVTAAASVDIELDLLALQAPPVLVAMPVPAPSVAPTTDGVESLRVLAARETVAGQLKPEPALERFDLLDKLALLQSAQQQRLDVAARLATAAHDSRQLLAAVPAVALAEAVAPIRVPGAAERPVPLAAAARAPAPAVDIGHSHTERVLDGLEALLGKRAVTASAASPAPTSKGGADPHANKVLQMLETVIGQRPTAAQEASKAPSGSAETGKAQGSIRGLMDDRVALNEARLDDIRGGFQSAGGGMESFGIERAVYINGTLVAPPTLVTVIGSAAGGAPAVTAGAGTITLIQSGAGNTFVSSSVSPATLGTVVQNTLNDQLIEHRTSISAVVNSLQATRAQNFESALRGALVDSLRR